MFNRSFFYRQIRVVTVNFRAIFSRTSATFQRSATLRQNIYLRTSSCFIFLVSMAKSMYIGPLKGLHFNVVCSFLPFGLGRLN